MYAQTVWPSKSPGDTILYSPMAAPKRVPDFNLSFASGSPFGGFELHRKVGRVGQAPTTCRCLASEKAAGRNVASNDPYGHLTLTETLKSMNP